nr:MAG TPA: hypothetical protein [Caudoviricetes sp.]
MRDWGRHTGRPFHFVIQPSRCRLASFLSRKALRKIGGLFLL